ncbi:MAG: ABC transporter ATP-binding protein [Chlorobiaceae bacterium]|nr:ABC transporter ATP-binding protein [Chlorobiaceae bacterium]NTW10233.1 ABC transporter ATP-binding protein [Chlorobiaceae bacterium]
MGIAVQLNNLTKKFGAVIANKNIDLSIEERSIHAIVGENGAGKSTLSKIIYGIYRPTSGSIAVFGREVEFGSPREAIRAGIGMVHQHFMLVPELTVTENIMLGDEHAGLFGKLPLKNMRSVILEEAGQSGFSIDPDATAGSLSVGEEQRVELLKLLCHEASILIFDEPTAVLTPSETDRLFEILRSLKAKGKTIILITHKLDEVLAVADTVSVMRKGEIVGTMPAASVTKPELATMMVGRTVLLRVENPPSLPGKKVLEVNALCMKTEQGRQKLKDLEFSIRAGEIYGIAGVEGNGQSELLQLLWGLLPRGYRISGDAALNGISIIGKKPLEIAAMGASNIPENRHRHAVILDYPVSDNLFFGRHRESIFHKGLGFRRKSIEENTIKLVADFDIRCDNPSRQPLGSLSGGNQQKVVLARELNRPGISFLILAQPTRGVDIGAIETIHRKIIETRRNGIAILLVSSELEEIIALSTRIGCIYNGTIRHEFTLEETALKRADEDRFRREIGAYIT